MINPDSTDERRRLALAGEMGDRRDAEDVQRFIERFAAALTESGIPRMPARVFVGLLVTDSGRLTAAEISELLKISPAAVSGAVKYLLQFNLLSREREPGTRRDIYQVHDDSWYEASISQDQTLTRLEESMREGVKVLGAETPAGARLTETLEFFEFLQNELREILERWQAHRDEIRRRSDSSS